MADDDVIRAIDIALDEVLRRDYPSCAERNAAVDRAMSELRID